MGRRWIMIELGEHCRTHIIPRLKKVIDGEDQGGITKAVNWQGGGFRYYSLAPSLLEQDRWGNWVVNKNYNPGMLAEAMCKLEGFTYAPVRINSHLHDGILMVPYDDLRKVRYSEAGHAYFITTVLADREKCYFDDFMCARLVVINMRLLHENQVVNSLAWVVMPDHVHWLFQLGATASLSTVVKTFKARTAHRVNTYLVKSGRFGKKVSMTMLCGNKRMFGLLPDILWQIHYVRA